MVERHRLIATAFTTLALAGMVLLGGCGKKGSLSPTAPASGEQETLAQRSKRTGSGPSSGRSDAQSRQDSADIYDNIDGGLDGSEGDTPEEYVMYGG